MPELAARTALTARQVGSVAARALRDGAAGSVRAVFANSAYVAFGDAWICIGPPALGAGPLNLVCDQWQDGEAARALRVGDRVLVENRTLLVGQALALRIAEAVRWHPEPVAAWSKDSLARGLAALDACLPALPAEGLALLLRPPRGDALPRVAAAAREPARYLADLLADAARGGSPRVEPDRLVGLLGLGPGLTPSGDDYLGGALIVLPLVGLARLRDAMWGALAPFVASHTNEVSGAHLRAAAEGFGSGALHDLLASVLTGHAPAVPSRVRRVAGIGHTSGWDALAGAVAVLRENAAANWSETGLR